MSDKKYDFNEENLRNVNNYYVCVSGWGWWRYHIITKLSRVDAVVMGSWCNGQLVVWAFIVILLLSSLWFIWNNSFCQIPAHYTSTASNIRNLLITPGLLYLYLTTPRCRCPQTRRWATPATCTTRRSCGGSSGATGRPSRCSSWRSWRRCSRRPTTRTSSPGRSSRARSGSPRPGSRYSSASRAEYIVIRSTEV